METLTDFPRKVVEWPDVRIVMPDGVELSARIWLPEDAEDSPVPAILEHLPYRKRDGTIARDQLTHPYLAGHGYACIRVDMRGNGDSQGLMHDEYERQEWDDAIAVMAWVAEQPWSTGTWGMMGISWGGFNSLQVAALRPEGLKAVISICTTVDRYTDDIHYKGGCMLGENLGWAAQMLAYSSRPPDPEVVGDDWRAMWLERLEAQPFLLETWLGHQRKDDYWKHGSVSEDFSAIQVPVLAVGGWHDGYRNAPAALVEGLNGETRAIVGPWIHKYPHFAKPEPAIGFLQEALRWWDQWLKGIDAGIGMNATERLWLMDSVAPERWIDDRPGRWISVDQPSEEQGLYLGEDGLQTTEVPFSVTVASPQTCGDGAGEFFPFAFGPELPADQTGDDAMSAVFDGSAMKRDTDIVGAPRVRLTVTPKGTSGHLAVRLCDLRPDGTSAWISHGFLNLQHHTSHDTPEPLDPGKAIDVEVTLDQCAYRLPVGHRLRVAVSTAYWPFIWPDAEAAGVDITAGLLVLPVRPTATGDETAFAAPEGAAPWDAETLRAPSMTRHVQETDDGTRTIRIDTDTGAFRDRAHGLETGATCREDWQIRPDDPLSASGNIRWISTMARGDWSIRTECRAWLTATATHWHPRARLEAWEGEEKVFEKTFARDIPRDGV
ncbi:MAG: CocE/NonD family hydrolase [Silicimonas sp.]|nr:CocE/NonD family hydrolase [Silicimonas sp.]